MKESSLSVQIESVVERARALRHEALNRKSRARIELFAKVSLRSRATRAPRSSGATIAHVHESGLAIRAMREGLDWAGFAATSGLSTEAFRWALDRACSFETHAPPACPSPTDNTPLERWDLDSAAELPSQDALADSLVRHPLVEWVEVTPGRG
jgi:hypothetical protein